MIQHGESVREFKSKELTRVRVDKEERECTLDVHLPEDRLVPAMERRLGLNHVREARQGGCSIGP